MLAKKSEGTGTARLELVPIWNVDATSGSFELLHHNAGPSLFSPSLNYLSLFFQRIKHLPWHKALNDYFSLIHILNLIFIIY